jgi:hypothetical protein
VALVVLNDLLQSWSADKLCVYSIRNDFYTLVPTQRVYQIGPGASDFDTVRPNRIESAVIEAVTESTGQTRHLLTLIKAQEYAAIPTALDQSVIPRLLFPDYAYPISSLYLWPVPSAATRLRLYTWEVVAGFTALSDTVDMPPAYRRALAYAFAVELAPQFARAISAEAAAIAKKSMEVLRGLNALNVHSIEAAPPEAAA